MKTAVGEAGRGPDPCKHHQHCHCRRVRLTAGTGHPFMLALMEKATCEAVADLLEDDETTVGTAMNITHIKASAIGEVITAKAILTEVDGRKLTFHVTARNDKNELVGSGTVERFVVLAEKFLRKVEGK